MVVQRALVHNKNKYMYSTNYTDSRVSHAFEMLFTITPHRSNMSSYMHYIMLCKHFQIIDYDSMIILKMVPAQN